MGSRDPSSSLPSGDDELNQSLGLYDLPAFARRGLDTEQILTRLHTVCGAARLEMLEMVHLRLRQWCRVAEGPDAWSAVFRSPLEDLWVQARAPAPVWADRRGRASSLRAAARDLAASVARFNRRWQAHIDSLELGPINQLIDHYNEYYLLEKECVVRSPRLAARLFQPMPRLTHEAIMAHHPLLSVPELSP